MKSFDFQPRTRVIFGAGAVERLGELARELNFKRTLLVADHGLVASGHVEEAVGPLEDAGVEVFRFHDFEVNPDTLMVENGARFTAALKIDSIIGLGGGSSMDCAKGLNFLLTNGGRMADYRGYGNAQKPMLPMIAIPTTAGTGSEAQSYALISDAQSHEKMACGDPKAAFRIALLDPALTVSQQRSITATSGYDAIAHAVETYVTTKRNPVSELFSREAWRMLEPNFERVLSEPDNIAARGAMQLGAFYAGVAIENSMLGATHACANPLTARYGTAHGAAIAMLLATVVRWNEKTGTDYRPLLSWASVAGLTPGEQLARRLEELAEACGLRSNLRSAGISETELPALAADAAQQWTGTFNPRPFDQQGAIEIYQCAY
jgi:alcohol dehydrogenase